VLHFIDPIDFLKEIETKTGQKGHCFASMDTTNAAESEKQSNEHFILATGLPAPEEIDNLDTLPDKPPHFEPTSGVSFRILKLTA